MTADLFVFGVFLAATGALFLICVGVRLVVNLMARRDERRRHLTTSSGVRLADAVLVTRRKERKLR